MFLSWSDWKQRSLRKVVWWQHAVANWEWSSWHISARCTAWASTSFPETWKGKLHYSHSFLDELLFPLNGLCLHAYRESFNHKEGWRGKWSLCHLHCHQILIGCWLLLLTQGIGRCIRLKTALLTSILRGKKRKRRRYNQSYKWVTCLFCLLNTTLFNFPIIFTGWKSNNQG